MGWSESEMVTVKSMYGLWPSKKAVEHLVVAGVVAERSVCGVQAERKPPPRSIKCKSPCSWAWVKWPTSVKKSVASYALRPLAIIS